MILKCGGHHDRWRGKTLYQPKFLTFFLMVMVPPPTLKLQPWLPFYIQVSKSQPGLVCHCTHVVVAAHLDTVANTSDTTVGERDTINIGVLASGGAAVERLLVTALVVLVVVVVVGVGRRRGRGRGRRRTTMSTGSGESTSGDGEESKNRGGELHVEGF